MSRLRPRWLFFVAAACFALALGTRTALRAGAGLAGRYYANATWTGSPTLSVTETEISTETLTRRWDDATATVFSAQWIGYLSIREEDEYAFEIASHGSAHLFVDNRMVVDNGGSHGLVDRQGSVRLTRGSHLIALDYVEAGGPYAFEWRWARAGGPYGAVPWWALSRKRVGAGDILAARIVTWIVWGTAILTLLAIPWAARDLGLDRSVSNGIRRHPQWACLALFMGLTILETWPLATDPARLSRNDSADTVLNEWILSWVVHQAPHDPVHLFDANIFYPERRTLAFSETLLVQSAFAAPLLWAGASPVFAYNTVLMLGFTLTGWAMCVVVARWTADWPGGIVAGILVAFSAHTLTRMPHLQAQHAEFLPLMLLALDDLLRKPRLQEALRLALWFTLQALSSYYLFVMTAMGLVVATLVRPESWWGRRGRDCAKYLGVAGVCAAVVLLPYLWPYWRVSQDQAVTRRLDTLLPVHWQDYVTTPARFDHWLLARWSSSSGLFPGFVGMGLAVVAIASGALRDQRARMCLALGVCGVTLSFGRLLPGYAWLYAIFPPLHGIRATARFGYFGTVAVGVLAGWGVAYLRRRGRHHWQSLAVAVLLPSVVTAESLAAPIGYQRVPAIPAIYGVLAGTPNAVVAELPLFDPSTAPRNAPYMLNSTVSWYRLVNGYSGFLPASYFAHYDALRDFPSSTSIAALQQLGVTHIFVHAGDRRVDPAQLGRFAPLRHVTTEGSIALYEVLPPATVR